MLFVRAVGQEIPHFFPQESRGYPSSGQQNWWECRMIETALYLMTMQAVPFLLTETAEYDKIYRENREHSNKLVLCFQLQVPGFSFDELIASSERARIRIICATQERRLREELKRSSSSAKLSDAQIENFIIYLMDDLSLGHAKIGNTK